jgi:hypothetical protein
VTPVKSLFSYFSYLFHILLVVFLVAVSAFALATNPGELYLAMLPWSGATLTYVVFFASLFGLTAIVLAVARRARVLFFLWTAAVFVFVVKGYFFSGYRFVSGSLSTAIWLVVLSLIAVFGGWFQWRSPRARMTKC